MDFVGKRISRGTVVTALDIDIAQRSVDHRRSSNADHGSDATAMNVGSAAGATARDGGAEGGLPQLASAVRIECVHAVVLGGHVDDVVLRAVDRERGHV